MHDALHVLCARGDGRRRTSHGVHGFATAGLGFRPPVASLARSRLATPPLRLLSHLFIVEPARMHCIDVLLLSSFAPIRIGS